MMIHPAIAQQLVAERQRDLLDHASRHRQAHAARAARSARPATAARSRPYLLRRVHAALTRYWPPRAAETLFNLVLEARRDPGRYDLR